MEIKSALAKVKFTPLLFFLLFFAQTAFAQRSDSSLTFKGALSVTHNGFSFIPSFSLGKPAAILDMTVGNKRLSFEPQFRFALEGRPWSFIFIYRYKLINNRKFQFTLGGHLPSIVFVTKTITTNGVSENVIVSQRFLAGELTPNYIVSKSISVGMYYLYGYGFDKGASKIAQFLAVRSNFSSIKLTDRIFLRFNPQIYYLKVDSKDGFYVTYALTLAMRNFPLSISHLANKAIHTNIVAKDFDWNVSLVYSFDRDFVRK